MKILLLVVILSFKSAMNTNSFEVGNVPKIVTPKKGHDCTGKRVAFIGNSILYYNDCPRLMETISNGKISYQNSCLRGGASLISILHKGNGMRNKFRTSNAIIENNWCKDESTKYDIGAPTVQALLCDFNDPDLEESFEERSLWDFVVMNDHTQSAARLRSRHETIRILLSDYVPMIIQCGGIPVLLMTAAYRRNGIIDTEDLGSFEEFSDKTEEGYAEMAKAMSKKLPPSQCPRIAPVGLAYKKVYLENKRMWERLYHDDDFHPSPYGTFLQACVLYITMFKVLPEENFLMRKIPDANEEMLEECIWKRARMMQPLGDDPQPRPDRSEALYLLDVAKRVCLEYELKMGENAITHSSSNL